MRRLIALFFVILSVFFFHSIPSLANQTTKVPSVTVQKTGNFVGQYLFIYYALARPMLFSSGNKNIYVSKIRKVVSVRIDGDTMSFPAVEIEKEGFREPFNYLILAISSSPDFVWQNQDGTVPTPLVDTKIYQNSYLETIAKANLNLESSVITWPLYSEVQ